MRSGTLLTALLLTSILHAQKVKVSWGEESKQELEFGSLVKGTGNEMLKLCFEHHGNGILTKKTIVPILSRYDNRLAEKSVKSFTADQENIKFDNLLSVGDNLFMFTSHYEKSEKATSFYAQKINSKTLTPVGRPVNLGVLAALDRLRQSNADYELSKDSSKILMFGLSPFSRKNNEKYYMAVYDQNLNKQWDNTVELPYLDKFVDVLDYLVDNKGNVGVILKHYDKEITREQVREDGARVPSYKTKVLLYTQGEAKPKEYVLSLQDKFVHELRLTADDNSNLSFFGLYKNKYDGYVNGYFLARLNQSSDKVDVKKMEPFPEELVTLVKKDKQGSDREKDPGLSGNFRLADVVEREDGSTDYLLEYYNMVMRTTRTKTGSYSYPVFTYGDVVDIHVSSDKPTGFVRLPKWQQTPLTYIYSSFKAVTTKSKLVLFYNDDRDNVERAIEKRPDDMLKFTKSVLAMAVIDQKDNLTRSMVYDHKDMKLTTCIRVSQKLGNDKIGLYAQRSGGLFSAARDMIGLLEVN